MKNEFNDIELELVSKLIIKLELFQSNYYRLDPRYFYNKKARYIIESMHHLAQNFELNESAIISNLKEKNVFEEIGGYEFIAELKSISKIISSVDILILKIKDKYTITEYNRIVKNEEIKSISELNKVILRINEIAENSIKHKKELYELVEEEEKRAQTEFTTENITGITELDSIMAISTGCLITVTAKPGHGKSGLSANIAKNHIDNEKPFYLLSGENSIRSQFSRLYSNELDVSSSTLKTSESLREVLESNFEKSEAYKQKIKKLKGKAYIEDGEISLSRIRQEIFSLRNKGCRIFCIDRFELMKDLTSKSLYASQEEVANKLRNLAVSTDSIIVLYVQVPKDIAKIKGLPKIMKGSQELSAASSINISIWLPYKENIVDSGEVCDLLGIDELKYPLTTYIDGKELKLAVLYVNKNTDGKASEVPIFAYFNTRNAMFVNAEINPFTQEVIIS